MDDNLLRELFATPPTEFVAARNAAAKALRAEKRRDEATVVAALRRPGWDDYALNVVAAEQPDTVGSFTDAAAAVRDAQAAAIEGRDGPDIRASLRELRDTSAELIRLAGEVLGRVGRQPGGGEINARLSEIAASATAGDTLRAGVLGSGGDDADELFAGLQPTARAPKPPSERPTRKPSRGAPPPATPDASEDRADRKRRRDALAAATRDQRAAAKVLTRAGAAVEAATEAAERAQRTLAAAQRDRDEAAEALAHADAAVEQAEAEANA